MNDHYIQFEEEYNKDFFVSLYENNSKILQGSFNTVVEESNLIFYEEINRLFDKFSIEVNNRNCSLAKIVRHVVPHTNPGNNGLIMFPVEGKLEISFYSYEPPIINGMTLLSPYPKDRVILSAVQAANLMKSKFETFIVDKPIAINRRKIFSYRPVNNSQQLLFLLKIPFSINWSNIQTNIESTYV